MMGSDKKGVYSLIAFHERVTFWLQRVRSLPFAVRMLHYLHVGLRITITQSHTHTMQQTRMHKAVTWRVEAKKLLSRRRQSEYRHHRVKKKQMQDHLVCYLGM